MDSERYTGPPTTRYYYTTEYLVECPRCKDQATVKTKKSLQVDQDTLICYSCHYKEYALNNVRYNAIVKRKCDNCGKEIETTISNNKNKVEKLTLSCPYCQEVRAYTPRNEAYQLGYKTADNRCDPIFNLPLWLQTEIKGRPFWAYNREHLTEIKNYVSAKLRERQTTTHMTMVERLPAFISSSKNRETILKAIDKMLST